MDIDDDENNIKYEPRKTRILLQGSEYEKLKTNIIVIVKEFESEGKIYFYNLKYFKIKFLRIEILLNTILNLILKS